MKRIFIDISHVEEFLNYANFLCLVPFKPVREGEDLKFKRSRA